MKTTSTPPKKLNRYTTLPVLLDLLHRKKLTLLNPKLWEDKNDSEVMEVYKKRKKITNLFALCFSYGDETVHHWKAFSNGTSGCCIEFDGTKLINAIDKKKIEGLSHGKVKYRKLKEVFANRVPLAKMPFTKRWPYRCEEEYRIIVETDNEHDSFFEINIPLDAIRRITISQQMPEQIYSTIKEYLKGLRGNPDSRISRSTLYENTRWINVFKEN